ncbi:primase-associated protein (plasmid) [Halococcus morrhuae DSM 1307]|nr:primase-associated protein [Halococcus morrhuae]
MTEPTPASPRDDTIRAWEVALNPRESTGVELTDVFQRGYNTYLENGERNETRMLADVEKFVLRAIDDQPSYQDVKENPSVAPDMPGRLVVFGTMGTIVLLENPELKQYHREIICHELVEKLFYKHLLAGVMQYDGGNYQLQRLAAEILYKRDHDDEYGSPPGRVVTDITPMPEWHEDMVYIEIPLVHAGMNTDVTNNKGESVCGIKNNCVYVPDTDFRKKFEKHVIGRNGTAAYLGKRLYQSMEDGQINYAAHNATNVREHIQTLLDIGHTDKLFAEKTHPDKLRVVLTGIENAPDERAQLNTWHSASELYDALEIHAQKTDSTWEKRKIGEIGSARSLGNYLGSCTDHDDVEIYRQRDDQENPLGEDATDNTNLYRLRFNTSEATTIQVSEIADILELPCLRNIHNFLLEEKPVRFTLYTYVRIILSLENDFTVEEIVEWFSQYPWFDEETTRYQTRYEKNRTNENGEPYQPVNCYTDNEQFTDFCIGIDNCEYEIHESLPLKNEVVNSKKKS